MVNNNFMNSLFEKAKSANATIVLPEGKDERVLEAANTIMAKKIAKVILLGDEKKITDYFKQKSYNLSEIQIINPETSELQQRFASELYEMRKDKGMTEEKAAAMVKTFNYFATMMVHDNMADGLVSGAIQSTADTVRPALQIIKSAKKGQSVSAFFIMICNGEPYFFADNGLVENPDEETLAAIAVESALSAMKFGIAPKVAMLSYSTYGSASSPMVTKVANATKIAKEKLAKDYADLPIILDGELQLDAAIVPEVAKSKCPDSPIKGEARVLIFPDLNAGNIGYKLVQRLGGAEAYGPVLQGLAKPVNDLSRGCKPDDIVGVAAITAIQAKK
ncbi:MAG: phosphate acetyltransferase [Alphaproteobacteria bacterium]